MRALGGTGVGEVREEGESSLSFLAPPPERLVELRTSLLGGLKQCIDAGVWLCSQHNLHRL